MAMTQKMTVERLLEAEAHFERARIALAKEQLTHAEVSLTNGLYELRNLARALIPSGSRSMVDQVDPLSYTGTDKI